MSGDILYRSFSLCKISISSLGLFSAIREETILSFLIHEYECVCQPEYWLLSKEEANVSSL